MAKGLLGQKIGMTQVYDEAGRIVPVTAIEAGPCVVLQVKTAAGDGYEALQLGFATKPRRTVNKPAAGHFKKAKSEPKRFVREIRMDSAAEYEQGVTIGVEALDGVKYVDVSGVTKGRGFAGVVRRWRFSGGRASHGATTHRAPGSIGSSADPSRVLKGTRMGGHMGVASRTVKRLAVVKIDVDKNLLLVKGSVPGPNGGFLMIREAR